MPPRAVDWSAEAAETARTAVSGGMQRPRGAADATGHDSTRALRRRLARFWACHKKKFPEWWLGLPQDEQVAFLRASHPFLAAKRGDRSVLVEGERHDVSGASAFAPEINAADLTSDGGRSLLALFEERAQQAANAAEQEVEGRTAVLVDDLEAQDVASMERLLQVGRVTPMPGSPAAGSVITVEHGQNRVLAANNAQGARALADLRQKYGPAGAVVDAQAYFLAQQRQMVLLSTLLVWGDSYRMDVLGREGRALSLRAMGCCQCGKLEAAEERGTDLLFCPCGWAVYCSKDCQKADWKGHREEHKRVLAMQQAQKELAQAAGEAAGEAGEAAGEAAAGSSVGR